MNLRSEIKQLIDRLPEINNRLLAVAEAIESQKAEHVAIQEEIEVKKTLIAQWTDVLEEHESKVITNQSLLESYTIIEKNQRKIDEMLEDLENKQLQIAEEIDQFKSQHTYLSKSIEDSLNREWQEKNDELNEIHSAIEQLVKWEQELNIIVKMFLSLFEYLGWRSNPKAIEHEKLIKVNQDLAQITDALNKFAEKQQALERLQETHQDITQQKKHALQQKEALSQREETQKAITESRKKIKDLSTLIKNAKTEILSLTQSINSKQLDKDIIEEERLQQEKTKVTRQITVLDKKLQFSQALAQIEGKRSEYLHKDRNKFFKSARREQDETNMTANYIALTKLQKVIKDLKTGLDDPTSQAESYLLTKIETKLLLWQIAENTMHQSLAFEQRAQEFERFQTELKELVDQLPIDNPLNDKGTQEYIKKITAPPPALPSNEINKVKKSSRR